MGLSRNAALNGCQILRTLYYWRHELDPPLTIYEAMIALGYSRSQAKATETWEQVHVACQTKWLCLPESVRQESLPE